MTTKLNLHQDTTKLLIRSYAERKITIQDTQYSNSVIVTPDQVSHWALNMISGLGSEQFAPLFELGYKPEIVLLGTGENLIFPQPHQTQDLINAQIGLEVMDTAAACRTYNVLADDGRKVVACLLL